MRWLVACGFAAIPFLVFLKATGGDGERHRAAPPLLGNDRGKEEPPPFGRAAVTTAPAEWAPLFDGLTLAGWQHLGGGKVTVQDGMIVLEHDAERRPGYLVSTLQARDVEVRFRCRVLAGDSGLFFRSRRHPLSPVEVKGPQVQLNPHPGRGLGGIFELHGRGWLVKPAADTVNQVLAAGEWLDGRLEARRSRVRVWVNNVMTAEWTDESPRTGFLAWQIHGGGPCQVWIQFLLARRLEE